MEQCLSVAVFYRARGQCWDVGHGAMPVCVGVLQSQRAMLGGRPRSNACLCRCSTEPEAMLGGRARSNACLCRCSTEPEGNAGM